MMSPSSSAKIKSDPEAVIIGSRRVRDKTCDGDRARFVAEEISWKALSDTFVGTPSLDIINGIFSLASSKAPQYE